jgi:hypothetical protein
MHAMQILRARPDDAAMLTEIAFAAKRHWGYPERWIESWYDVLTVDPEFIVSHETYAAVIEGQTVGFYALGQNGDRVDLMHMWVLEQERRELPILIYETDQVA